MYYGQPKSSRLSVRIEENLLKDFQKVAEKQNKSMGGFLREILIKEITKSEQESEEDEKLQHCS